jgi:2'-5' RNA ligase
MSDAVETSVAESAIAVNVPEAEPFVGALRQQHDPSARLGAPAHITVLYPFMPPARIDAAVVGQLREALAPVAAFKFRLTGIGRFPSAIYLRPEPPEPFVRLTRLVEHAFPGYPAYAGKHGGSMPHLTVAQADDVVHDAVERCLTPRLPPGGIAASCSEVVLIENSSGRWLPMHRFPLAT